MRLLLLLVQKRGVGGYKKERKEEKNRLSSLSSGGAHGGCFGRHTGTGMILPKKYSIFFVKLSFYNRGIDFTQHGKSSPSTCKSPQKVDLVYKIVNLVSTLNKNISEQS